MKIEEQVQGLCNFGNTNTADYNNLVGAPREKEMQNCAQELVAL